MLVIDGPHAVSLDIVQKMESQMVEFQEMAPVQLGMLSTAKRRF
jgi:hypothetical protein